MITLVVVNPRRLFRHIRIGMLVMLRTRRKRLHSGRLTKLTRQWSERLIW